MGENVDFAEHESVQNCSHAHGADKTEWSRIQSQVQASPVSSTCGKNRVFDCWEWGQKGPECEQVICRHRTALIGDRGWDFCKRSHHVSCRRQKQRVITSRSRAELQKGFSYQVKNNLVPLWPFFSSIWDFEIMMNAPACVVHHNRSQQTSQTEELSAGLRDRSQDAADPSLLWTGSFRRDSEQCGEGISEVTWEGAERGNQAEGSSNANLQIGGFVNVSDLTAAGFQHGRLLHFWSSSHYPAAPTQQKDPEKRNRSGETERQEGFPERANV